MRQKAVIILLVIFTTTTYAGGRDSIAIDSRDSLCAITLLQEQISDQARSQSLFLFESSDILSEAISFSSNPADSSEFFIAKGRAIIDKIRDTQNYISNIDEASTFQLPVGLKKYIPGLKWDLGISAFRVKPLYAELDIYLEFEVSQSNQKLMFMGRNIKYTKKGGIVGDARLELLGDYGINMSGDKIQLILKGSKTGTGTYATIDCDGFKEMGIDAEVKFSRDLIRPENDAGTLQPGNVVATFNASILNWNDLVVQLNMPRFQATGLNGFSFAARNIVFDFSDFRNAPGVVFPEGYLSDYFLPENSFLWRGFYAHELTVQLPPQFKTRNGSRTSFQAFDLIIDEQGVSGKFMGEHLLDLNSGDMDGWSFSLDSLGLELQANQLVQAGFNGNLVLPIAREQTPLEYHATFSGGGNYLFNISPANNMTFPLWQAGNVEIYQSSFIEVRLENEKFIPKVSLNGQMTITARPGKRGQAVELANISFERLEIQSVKPYVKVGDFSFGSEVLQQKMAGFPVSINNIGLKSISDTEVGLDFDLLLNLVGEGSGGFAADAGLTVIGSINKEGGRQSWSYKDIEVRKIAVDIDGGAFKFNGSLEFFKNDTIYGDGFNGALSAEFPLSIKVSASAVFGNVSGMRYWYVDALAEFPSAIQIFPGVALKGFGGGAYYRMKVDNTGGESSHLGRTRSGIVYAPMKEAGLGIKATVMIGSVPPASAFTADVTLEIAFYLGGGVRYISFLGNAFMATQPAGGGLLAKLESAADKMSSAIGKLDQKIAGGGLINVKGGNDGMVDQIYGPVASAPDGISARVFIDYDFENRVLHGNFSVKINAAKGLIQGGGEAVLHFAPDVWYILVGTPDNRFRLGFGIGSIRANADAYFVVGSQIPGSPPPPENVTRILGGSDYNYMKNLNDIGSGKGFGFGASFSLSTGDLQFLIFYASFNAGAGFDIMLKNYGDVYCVGSNERIGINGWYANGQAYAYFEGAVGIRVKVFGKKREVEILRGGAAVLLQAKLPRPFWMKGVVGGYYSVLGGLVKGKFNFEITLGNECVLENRNQPTNVLESIKVISQITPAQGDQDVNVFNIPQAVFNMPVEEVFTVADEDVQRSFRIKLDQFKITSNGQDVAGTLQWNNTHDVLAYNSYDILPPQKDIKAFVQVSFEELRSGSWAPVIDNGQRVIERQEITFKTGTAPDYIPLTNVEYSYPIIGQLNFYKDESNEGYIKLKKGQPYLFTVDAAWRQTGRFSTPSGTKSEFGFTHNNGQVNFTIPSGLATNQIYAFELVNVPVQRAGAIDRNVSDVTAKADVGDASLDTEIKGKKAEGAIDELQEKSIFTAYMKSSNFSSLSAKLNSLQAYKPYLWWVDYGVFEIRIDYRGAELFDKYETNTGLLQFEGTLDNQWYSQKVKSIVYDDYPINGILTIKKRDVNIQGLPPVRAVYFNGQSQAELNGTTITPFSSIVEIGYNLPLAMSKDFYDLATQAANLSLNGSSARINYLLTTPFPVITYGSYRVKVNYVLPGINKITSTSEITINYAP